jgi:hypothetical protein
MKLIGRKSDLRRLEGLRAESVFVVSGDPGVGKTALLAHYVEESRARGHTVVTAVGVESESTLPFAALRELVTPILHHAAELPDASREALESALGLRATTVPDRHAIGLAVEFLVRAASENAPLDLVIDDVQWVDAATQSALAVAAARLDGENLTIVLAARLGYDVPLLAAPLPELRVEPLDDDAASRLLARVAPDLTDEQAALIRTEAQGNPLALIELPGADRGPHHSRSRKDRPLTARLEGAFAARLDAMPPLTRDILLCAAIDDRSDIDEVLAAASHLSTESVAPAPVAAAENARLVIVDGTEIRFRHPLVRSAVLRAESSGRRMRAHAALSAVIDDPQRTVWHLAESTVGPDDDVAAQLEAAVPAVLLQGGVETAIANLERAAELTTDSALRGARLLAAAPHAFDIGRSDVVDRLLTAAAKEDLDALGRARLHLIREIFDDGTPGDAVRVLELCTHARHASAAGDDSLALDLLLGAALRCWWADTGPAARSRVVAVTQSLEGVEADARYIAALGVAEPLAMCGTVAQLLDARAQFDDARADELRLLGMAAHATGDEPRADVLLRASETRLREQGRIGLLVHVLSMSVVVRQELGDLQGAAEAAAEGRRLADLTGQPIWNSGTIVCESRARALRGDVDGALELAAEAERLARQRRLNDLLSCVQLAKGMAWFVRGQVEDAFDAFREMFDPGNPAFHQRERFDGIMMLAESARATGDPDALATARSIVSRLEIVARATPSPLLHAQLAYARPVLADEAEAGALFEQAARTHLSAWPWVSARIDLEYGSWMARHGRLAESREHLRRAREAFARMSASPWEAAATARLEEVEHILGPGE